MDMNIRSTAPPEEWVEASYEISRHLQKSGNRHSRWETLSIQKWIKFLRDPDVGGAWYQIEQMRRIIYGKFFGYASPLTCKFPSVSPSVGQPTMDDVRGLEQIEKIFCSEYDIEQIHACEIKIGRRKLVVPRPIYKGPFEEVARESPCRCYFASDGVMAGRHRKLGHNPFKISPPYKSVQLRLHPDIKREDILESWPMIEEFKGSGNSIAGQKREAPKLARNMRWAEMYSNGKSLNQIVTAELKSKAGYSWRSRYPSSTRSKLKKVIREALRKQAVLGKDSTSAKPVK